MSLYRRQRVNFRTRGPNSTPHGVGVAQKTIRTGRTLHWDDLPHWQRDNHHIHTGYRTASASFMGSFKSLAYIHNETVNIYTHLLPSLVTIPISLVIYREMSARHETATREDIAAFG